jgi:hypothetical protein
MNFESQKYTFFVFLSANWLALSCMKPFSFLLAHIPSDWNVLPHPGHRRTGPTITRILLLPQLKEGVSVYHFLCRGRPNPSVYGARYGRDRQRPFTPDPEKAIIISRLWLRDTNHNLRIPMAFVVHRRALLSLLNMEPSESNGMYRTQSEVTNGETVWAIPWRGWGPERVRWFPTKNNIVVWLTVSYGARLVLAEQLAHDECNIKVYDFGTPRVKKAVNAVRRVVDGHDALGFYAASNWMWALDSEDCVNGCGDLPMGGTDSRVLSAGVHGLPQDERSLFAEDVVSSLPHISVSHRVEGSYQGVIMEDECLIGLKVCYR